MDSPASDVGAGRALVSTGRGARSCRLILHHPVFSSFASPFFRMSDFERKPVLVIPLDDREASLSVTGMMREFRITGSDKDGIMLAMVGEALDFVTGLRIGDWLPTEILTGEASWVADETFQERALVRLNLYLLAWMSSGTSSVARDVLCRVGQVEMSAEDLTAGLRLMASKLGGITPDEALARIRRVAIEFAYVEALRDGLLRGAARMVTTLDRLLRALHGDTARKDLLAQVRRLAVVGVADLQGRFDKADCTVADIEEVVMNPDAVISTLRWHRDSLYVRCRAWDRYVVEWGTLEMRPNARTWQLVYETYCFLAPRFMTIVEWRSVPDLSAGRNAGRSGMAW